MERDRSSINKTTDIAPTVETRANYSEFRRVVRVFFGRKIAVAGLVIIVVLVITAIFAPLLAPYPPDKMALGQDLQLPSWQHLLGTDSVGRDQLSRIIYGARTSLIVGFGAVGLSSLVGQTLGMLAGYFGGWVFTLIMRLTDALMAIPMLLLALVIAAVLGSGLKNVVLALSVGMLPIQIRLMCGMILAEKQNDYILAARSGGASDLRIILVHAFPNAFPTLLVMITIGLGTTILAEAGLSFLGLGVDPTGSAWGSMINDGYKFLMTNPNLSFSPGIAIMLVVFGFNMMGDGLRDALDPRLRGKI
jgi:peptide/nickel transport system permease protein